MSGITIILWLIGIHVFELLCVFGYRIVKKNNQLYNIAVKQQQYIDAISIIIANSSEKLNELDVKGAFKSDDEVGQFFTNLIEIQKILDNFNNNK